MKLITEELNADYQVITEEKEGGNKKLYIEGVFLQSAVKNKNRRIYPEHVMDKEVARYTKTLINEGRAMGELGHPKGPTINLDRVSHVIESLTKSGKDWIGKAKITSTPMGKIAEGLINDGVRLGVSSRGMGTLKPLGEAMEVQEDFHLATAADMVADPSAPNAFVNGIMENKEWVCENGIWTEQTIEEVQNEVNASVRSREFNEEKMLEVFERLLKQ